MQNINCGHRTYDEIKKMSLLATVQFQNSYMDTKLLNPDSETEDAP